MSSSTTDKITLLGRTTGVLRSPDLEANGISRRNLSRLCRRGILTRVGRGLYVLSDAEYTEHHTLAEVCKRVPSGVVCLISALSFHDVTTQMPQQVWLAIDRKRRMPNEPKLPLKVVRFSGAALESGVEEHEIEGVPVRVYSVAKTIADCFKFRNKIGLDVCLEALRESLRDRRCTADEIWKFAKVCRVANVMRPYLEATV